MQRHLQDQHTGIGYQCDMCKLLFVRKNSKHACNITEDDMVYMHRESGVRGAAAKEMMRKFISEVQDTKWKFVESTEEAERYSREYQSAMVRPNDRPRQPRPRKKRREPSPFPLEDPDITLEEPPFKIPRIVKEKTFVCDLPLEAVPLHEQVITSPEIVSTKTISEKEMRITERQNRVFKENQTINKSQKEVTERNLREVEKKMNEKQKTVNGKQKTVNERQMVVNEKQMVNEKQNSDNEKQMVNEKQLTAHEGQESGNEKQKLVNETQKKNISEGQTEDGGVKKQKEKGNETQNKGINDKKRNKGKQTNKTEKLQEEKENERSAHKRSTDKKDKVKNVIKQTDTENEQSQKQKTTESSETKEKVNENSNVLDNILKEMTNPYQEVITPISGESLTHSSDNEEIERAVASILDAPEIRDTIDRAVESVSEHATEYIEEIICGEIMSEMEEVVAQEEVCIMEEIEMAVNEGVMEEASSVISESVIAVRQEEMEEERLRKERKRKRKAEKKRKRIESLSIDTDNDNNNNSSVDDESEVERRLRKESKKLKRAEKRDAEQKDVCRNEVPLCLEPHVTEPDRRAQELEKLQTYLEETQKGRVILNIGGQRFETSKPTLQKDPESLFALLFKPGTLITPVNNTYFFDRDPAHFRLIINYLRNGCQLPTPAVLPKERRYLLELKSECEFYQINGFKTLVDKRLKQLDDLDGLDQ